MYGVSWIYIIAFETWVKRIMILLLEEDGEGMTIIVFEELAGESFYGDFLFYLFI